MKVGCHHTLLSYFTWNFASLHLSFFGGFFCDAPRYFPNPYNNNNNNNGYLECLIPHRP